MWSAVPVSQEVGLWEKKPRASQTVGLQKSYKMDNQNVQMYKCALWASYQPHDPTLLTWGKPLTHLS